MERGEQKGPQVTVQKFRENHSGLPEAGSMEITVTTTTDELGRITEIKTDRGNSLVASTLTTFEYDSKGLQFIQNHVYSDQSPWRALLELVDVQGNNSVFLPDPDLRRSFDQDFREPRSQKPIDYSGAIEQAKKMHHPAVRVLEGEESAAVIWTYLYTFEGITFLYSKVWNFQNQKDGKIILKKIVDIKNLRGNGEESWIPDDLSETKEFVYDAKGLKGINVYKGRELHYRDEFEYWKVEDIIVGEKPAEVFNVRRTFGERTVEQAGERGRYYKFVDLIIKDSPWIAGNAFRAVVSDSIPIHERKVGTVFTREIDFPTIPGKLIRVKLEVVEIKAGQPMYREVSLEVINAS